MSDPVFDPGSPYAATKFECIEGYARLQLPVHLSAHPVARSRGRVMAHRAVLFDAIGPGPHDCALCGWSGLRWDIDQKDELYLVVDHIDCQPMNNRADNLRPSCKWCNSNRMIIERLGLPWSTWADVPPGERQPMRNKQTGEPTRAAHALKASLSEPPPCRRREPAPAASAAAATWQPGRLVTWGDVVDLAALARGQVVLRPPPEELLDRFPALRGIDFGVFGR